MRPGVKGEAEKLAFDNVGLSEPAAAFLVVPVFAPMSALPPKADLLGGAAISLLMTQSGHWLDYGNKFKLRCPVCKIHQDGGALAAFTCGHILFICPSYVVHPASV